MAEGIQSLTEKEKETLRLVVRGHDAKSMARHLGLSVHTINERLRDARRKLAVSSSREAARLLLAREATVLTIPQLSGDDVLRDAAFTGAADGPATPRPVRAMPGARRRRAIGGLIMTILAAAIALAMMTPLAAPVPLPADGVAAQAEGEAARTARDWLALVDTGNWEASWAATATTFRQLNTAQTGAEVSRKVRVPLGAASGRRFSGEEAVPAPPAGVEVVRFRTHFAAKGELVETLSLVREDRAWRVVGYFIG